MRVCFAALPLAGHFFPLVPLAFACRDAGHDVAVVSAAGYEEAVARLGLRFVPAGAGFGWALPVTRERYPELAGAPEPRLGFGAALFMSVLAPEVAAALPGALARERPDLVVFELYDAGAAVAAAELGIPAVCHGLNRLPPAAMVDEMAARLGAVREERGLEPAAPLNGLAGALYLDVCPPAMQDAEALSLLPRLAPLRPQPWEGGGELPAWLAAPRERPRAYLTLGTVVNTGEGALRVFRTVIDGLASAGIDAIVTVGADGDPEALAPLPGGVRVERFLPQSRLLEHVDLAVHHCGAGTLFGAAAAALPQLGIPLAADQHFCGAPALRDAGVGTVLRAEELSPESVAAAARAMLEDGDVPARARLLAAEIAALPGPAAVVPLLERLAARRAAAAD